MYVLFLVRRKRGEKSINYERNQTFKKEMSIVNYVFLRKDLSHQNELVIDRHI